MVFWVFPVAIDSATTTTDTAATGTALRPLWARVPPPAGSNMLDRYAFPSLSLGSTPKRPARPLRARRSKSPTKSGRQSPAQVKLRNALPLPREAFCSLVGRTIGGAQWASWCGHVTEEERRALRPRGFDCTRTAKPPRVHFQVFKRRPISAVFRSLPRPNVSNGQR